jgi:pimeloyl-ACP methyl ester carboxylesterase
MPTVRVYRATIHYDVHGAGSPLVLAHGAGGNTLIWYQQVPYFAQRHRVINFDHRCFGRSACEREDLDFRYFGDDLLAVLDAEEIERAAIVAHDMGGFSGLRLALERPERVSCLVLCSTAGGVMSDGILDGLERASVEYSRRGPSPEQVLAKEFVESDPARAFLLLQIFVLNRPLDPVLVANVIESRVWSEELAGYDTPTLVIGGGQDWIFPPDVLREAAALIPGAEMIEFPDAGHSPYFEAPAEFNRVVGDFVQRHGGAPGA